MSPNTASSSTAHPYAYAPLGAEAAGPMTALLARLGARRRTRTKGAFGKSAYNRARARQAAATPTSSTPTS